MKFFSLLIFSLALACSGGSGDYVAESEEKAAADGLTFTTYKYDEASGADDLDNAGKPIEVNQQTREQQIIKTGHLEFETSNLDTTHVKIMGLVNRYQGIVQNDNSGKSYGKLYQNVTVRIPSEYFQSFMDGVSEGVKYFDRKDISQKDVTEEFVDLEARLKAKRELEKRYLELLKQAKNVKEMLEIERELSNIREEVEAKQGRLNYLKDRVSLSTITLHFYKTTSQTGVTVSYGQKMKNAFKGGWDGISVFFLGLLYLWPLFLLLLIGILILRRYLKRKKAKN
ncbi:MAG: DUF4349 domain-containing protein [Aureisphaera sp.]